MQPPQDWNPDCAGHSFLADGRLLMAGGTISLNPLRGSMRAYLFDPPAESWIRVEDMNQGRWYPSNVTLGDGRVVTMSGVNDTNGALNTDIEAWEPGSATNWNLLGQRLMPDYPYLHLMPGGLVFRSGPDQQTEAFDPATAAWTPVDATNFPARYEAPSVLLPPTLDRVMIIGGFNGAGGQPTHSAEIIDFSVATPQWTPTSSMTFNRMEHNAVLLPDGKVLVVGGRSNNGGEPVSVLIPEIFDPVNGGWDQVAPHQVPRRYHSTAILLPDGRVLAAGGNFEASGEIYSPPYLFRGPRPQITQAPALITYGGTFLVEFTSQTAANTVALVRYSSVTHSVNMDQRYVRLADDVAAGAPSTVPAPANANLAPPGFYMLHVVDAGGVPSESALVQVLPPVIGDVNGDGVIDVGDLLDVLGSWGPCPAPPQECRADVDGDGAVGVSDLLLVLAAELSGGLQTRSIPRGVEVQGSVQPTDRVSSASHGACRGSPRRSSSRAGRHHGDVVARMVLLHDPGLRRRGRGRGPHGSRHRQRRAQPSRRPGGTLLLSGSCAESLRRRFHPVRLRQPRPAGCHGLERDAGPRDRSRAPPS